MEAGWESANTQRFLSTRTEYDKRQNKPLNLKTTVQTWTLSEVTNKQNASVSNGLFLVRPARSIDSVALFSSPGVYSWSVRMRNIAWVPSAWFMKPRYWVEKCKCSNNKLFLTGKFPSMELISSGLCNERTSQSTDPSTSYWQPPLSLTYRLMQPTQPHTSLLGKGSMSHTDNMDMDFLPSPQEKCLLLQRTIASQMRSWKL